MRSVRRYRIGRDLTPLEVTESNGCLEGRKRLVPGHVIAVVGLPSSRGPVDRLAFVESWKVARLGQDGTVYRGVCRWLESDG